MLGWQIGHALFLEHYCPPNLQNIIGNIVENGVKRSEEIAKWNLTHIAKLG